MKLASDGSMTMQIRHITVQLQQGDLTQENTDAIVNSAGHDLSLSGKEKGSLFEYVMLSFNSSYFKIFPSIKV